MENTGQVAVATVADARAAGSSYAGDARIDGVPGHRRAGAARLPRHRRLELRRAAADRQRGRRDRRRRLHADRQRHALRRAARRRSRRRPATRRREALEADADAARRRLEAIRLKAGPLMNLGDVDREVGAEDDAGRRRRGTAARSPPARFIPHRVPRLDRRARRGQRRHRLPAAGRAGGGDRGGAGGRGKDCSSIEHPTGEMSVVATVRNGAVERAGVLRTARKLFDGEVFAR